MIKYVIAACVVVLAWGLALFLDVHWAFPVLLTLVVAAGLGAFVAYRSFKARRAARELARGLAAQALHQEQHARPDLQAEIQQMQGEFTKAVQTLKSSKLGASGVDALYALPWYVIVGPPGSGKTTALRESGLQFPVTSSRGALKGLGGTRNCDWWLTNQGVLLDTAGRWTDAEDRDEWMAFLDLVKATRPRKPLNGIIVAVSVADLGAGQETDIESLARRVRERIDEVLGRLQMQLPVYVLFTKSDLIPGFVESFRDLSAPQRSQVWGFTLPGDGGKASVGDTCDTRFDEIESTLERYSLRRLGEVQKIEDREKIFGFVHQFHALRDPMTNFLAKVFEQNVYQETPTLRGVYFTSGTQEGRPIDRVMRRMAEALGVSVDVALPSASVESKSYFLRDVFANVVFEDADLAARSVSEQKRQSRFRIVTAAAIFSIAMLVSVLPTWSWWQNRELLQSTRTMVEGVAAARATGRPAAALAALDPLRERAALLRSYSADGPPLTMRYGMYQGDAIAPGVLALYARVLRADVLQHLVAAELGEIEEFGRRYEALADARPTPAEHAQLYDVLKAYLLLTGPTEASQPALDQTMQAWLASSVVTRWSAANGTTSPAERARMEAHSLFFASLLSQDARVAFPRDVTAVQRSRVALTRVPRTNLLLERLIRDLEPSGYGITLRALIGPSVTAMNARSSVRAAFTRAAWESSVRDTLAAPPTNLAGEAWVLGPEAARQETDEAERHVGLARLASEYFRQYIEEWQEFVRGVRVATPNGEVQSLTTLQDLTRGEPAALGRLIRQVNYNLQLTYPEPPAEQAPAAVGILDTVAAAAARRAPVAARVLRGATGALRENGASGAQAADEQLLLAADVPLAFNGFTAFAVPAEAAAGGQAAQSTPFDVYQEQLEFVRDALQTQLENPGPRDQLVARLQTARVRVRALIEEQEIGWRPRFDALLWPPIDGASLGSTRAGAVGAARGWCSDVVQPFERNVGGRYPFNAAGQDTALADFTEFFKRDGTLWTFYDESLDSAIERQGDGFAFATRLGRDASLVYSRDLPGFLQASNDVTSSFFPPGSPVARVDFDVQIHPSPEVATIELTVGGAPPLHSENGPESWERVTWPGEHPEQGALLELRGGNGMVERIEQEGEWGLFHLLEAGTIVNGDARVFTIAFHVRTHDLEVRMSIRPVRGDNPFFGVVGRSARPTLMQPTRSRSLEMPREIATSDTLCQRR